jgi:hypothetical protein
MSQVFPQTYRNASGKKIFTIKEGIVRTSDSRRIGTIDKNWTIRDKSGRRMGTFNDRAIRDGHGKLLFKLDEKGVLRKSSGRRQYLIQDNGDVRDADHRRIGSADGLSVKEIAIILVFFNFS